MARRGEARQGNHGRQGEAGRGTAGRGNHGRRKDGQVSKKSKDALAVGAAPNTARNETVTLKQRGTSSIGVRIVGITPLIQNNFSQKAMEQMLSKHVGRSVERQKKNPRQCIEDAKVLNMRGEVCVPPVAIKKAMLTAMSNIKTAKPWQVKQAVFVDALSVPVKFASMQPRLDMVRTSGMNRVPDVRFRPQFNDWEASLVIVYAPDIVSLDLVLNLIQLAGDGVGVGEWRPEKSGTFGRFRLDPDVITDPKKIGVIREACSSALVPLTIPEWAMDADIDPELLADIIGGKPSAMIGEEHAAE